MPWTPISVSAWRTSSSLKGLIMATTSFMVRPSFSQRFGRTRLDWHRTSLASFYAIGTKSLQTQPKNDCGVSIALVRGGIVRKILAFFTSTGASTRSFPLAQRAFLRHRGHQGAVLLEDHAARQPAAALRARRILGIKQPFVGAERAVKPHRVIEARRHHALVEQSAAVARHRRIEQREIRRIGQRAHMQRRIVRQFRGGADPDMDAAVVDPFTEIAPELDRAKLDRA